MGLSWPFSTGYQSRRFFIQIKKNYTHLQAREGLIFRLKIGTYAKLFY